MVIVFYCGAHYKKALTFLLENLFCWRANAKTFTIFSVITKVTY
jgi:hypothetical protein